MVFRYPGALDVEASDRRSVRRRNGGANGVEHGSSFADGIHQREQGSSDACFIEAAIAESTLGISKNLVAIAVLAGNPAESRPFQ